jgi:hypothetical protein
VSALRDELAEVEARFCTGEYRHLRPMPHGVSRPCSRDYARADSLLPVVARAITAERERIAAEQETWRDGATEDGANLYTDTPYGIASTLIRITRGES